MLQAITNEPTVDEMAAYLTRKATAALRALSPEKRRFGVFDTSGIRACFTKRYGTDVRLYADATVAQASRGKVGNIWIRGAEGRLFFLKEDMRLMPDVHELRSHHGIQAPINR